MQHRTQTAHTSPVEGGGSQLSLEAAEPEAVERLRGLDLVRWGRHRYAPEAESPPPIPRACTSTRLTTALETLYGSGPAGRELAPYLLYGMAAGYGTTDLQNVEMRISAHWMPPIVRRHAWAWTTGERVLQGRISRLFTGGQRMPGEVRAAAVQLAVRCWSLYRTYLELRELGADLTGAPQDESFQGVRDPQATDRDHHKAFLWYKLADLVFIGVQQRLMRLTLSEIARRIAAADFGWLLERYALARVFGEGRSFQRLQVLVYEMLPARAVDAFFTAGEALADVMEDGFRRSRDLAKSDLRPLMSGLATLMEGWAVSPIPEPEGLEKRWLEHRQRALWEAEQHLESVLEARRRRLEPTPDPDAWGTLRGALQTTFTELQAGELTWTALQDRVALVRAAIDVAVATAGHMPEHLLWPGDGEDYRTRRQRSSAPADRLYHLVALAERFCLAVRRMRGEFTAMREERPSWERLKARLEEDEACIFIETWVSRYGSRLEVIFGGAPRELELPANRRVQAVDLVVRRLVEAARRAGGDPRQWGWLFCGLTDRLREVVRRLGPTHLFVAELKSLLGRGRVEEAAGRIREVRLPGVDPEDLDAFVTVGVHVFNAGPKIVRENMLHNKHLHWATERLWVLLGSSSSNRGIAEAERELCLETGATHYFLSARRHQKAGNQNRVMPNVPAHPGGRTFYLTLDDDYLTGSQTLQRLVPLAQRHPKAAFVQVPMYLFANHLPGLSRARYADAAGMSIWGSVTSLGLRDLRLNPKGFAGRKTLALPFGTCTLFRLTPGASSLEDTNGFYTGSVCEDFGQGLMAFSMRHFGWPRRPKGGWEDGILLDEIWMEGDGVELYGRIKQQTRWCEGSLRNAWTIWLPAVQSHLERRLGWPERPAWRGMEGDDAAWRETGGDEPAPVGTAGAAAVGAVSMVAVDGLEPAAIEAEEAPASELDGVTEASSDGPGWGRLVGGTAVALGYLLEFLGMMLFMVGFPLTSFLAEPAPTVSHSLGFWAALWTAHLGYSYYLALHCGMSFRTFFDQHCLRFSAVTGLAEGLYRSIRAPSTRWAACKDPKARLPGTMRAVFLGVAALNGVAAGLGAARGMHIYLLCLVSVVTALWPFTMLKAVPLTVADRVANLPRRMPRPWLAWRAFRKEASRRGIDGHVEPIPGGQAATVVLIAVTAAALGIRYGELVPLLPHLVHSHPVFLGWLLASDLIQVASLGWIWLFTVCGMRNQSIYTYEALMAASSGGQPARAVGSGWDQARVGGIEDEAAGDEVAGDEVADGGGRSRARVPGFWLRPAGRVLAWLLGRHPLRANPGFLSVSGAWVFVALVALGLRLPHLNANGVFMDESFYIIAGRRFLEEGVSIPLASVMFGSYLYPAITAVVSGWAGIEGTRLLSILFGTVTALAVGQVGMRLMGRGAAIVAALLAAVSMQGIYISALATYDAASVAGLAVSVALLASAVWDRPAGTSAERGRTSGVAAPWAQPADTAEWKRAVLLLTSSAALLFGILAKYVAVIFLPGMLVMALAAPAGAGWRAWMRRLERGVLFGLPVGAGLVYYGLENRGVLEAWWHFSSGYRTLVSRDGWQILDIYALQGWNVLAGVALAVAGAVWVARSRGKHAARGAVAVPAPAVPRLAVAFLLAQVAVFAAFQAVTRADFNYLKHVNYVAPFLWPMAAVGMLSIVARARAGLERHGMRRGTAHVFAMTAILTLMLLLGLRQIDVLGGMLRWWPDLRPYASILTPGLRIGDRVLTDDTSLEWYTLDRAVRVDTPFYTAFGALEGPPAAITAIRARAYTAVVLSGGTTGEGKAMHAAVAGHLEAAGYVRLYRPAGALETAGVYVAPAALARFVEASREALAEVRSAAPSRPPFMAAALKQNKLTARAP